MKKTLYIAIPLLLIVVLGMMFKERSDKLAVNVFEDADKIEVVKEMPLPKVQKVEPAVKIVENSGNHSPIKDESARFDEPKREEPHKFEESRLSEQEIEDLEEYFEKVEKEWNQKVEDLLLGELGMAPQVIQDFHSLREAYDQEKIESFQEFHEFMEEKYGEDYSFTPNQDMEATENKVLDVYQGRLRKLLGDSGHQRYRDTLDEYNKKIKSEQDETKGIMLIEM
jgi:hypothetical protein